MDSADEMDILTLESSPENDAALRTKAEKVQKIGPEYKKITQEMFQLLRDGKGIGLAGPQVGRNERIFVTEVDKDQPRVFINPTIVGTSEETGKYEEGCMSLPGVFADVTRPLEIRVQAWNEKGRPFTLDAEGLLARVIQHENDHLEGILFIDRLSEPKRASILRKYHKKRHN
ncbi:MAG: peptide deformylase [Spirochaetaceae bacterium]|jgi:peptide deformylase|nr:peptide deformylase [Spirochaetaceae bacterium]